jgi:hypothetical protein
MQCKYGYHTSRGLGGTVGSGGVSLGAPIRPCHYSRQDAVTEGQEVLASGRISVLQRTETTLLSL